MTTMTLARPADVQLEDTAPAASDATATDRDNPRRLVRGDWFGCPDLPADGYDRHSIAVAEHVLRKTWQRYARTGPQWDREAARLLPGSVIGAADNAPGEPLMAEELIEIWRTQWDSPYQFDGPDTWALAVLDRHLVTFPGTYPAASPGARQAHLMLPGVALARLTGQPDPEPEPESVPIPRHARIWLGGAGRYPEPAPPRPVRDVLGGWMLARTVAEGRTKTRVLHEDYRAWCADQGEPAADETGFARLLAEAGLPPFKTNGTMHRRLTLLAVTG